MSLWHPTSIGDHQDPQSTRYEPPPPRSPVPDDFADQADEAMAKAVAEHSNGRGWW